MKDNEFGKHSGGPSQLNQCVEGSILNGHVPFPLESLPSSVQTKACNSLNLPTSKPFSGNKGPRSFPNAAGKDPNTPQVEVASPV